MVNQASRAAAIAAVLTVVSCLPGCGGTKGPALQEVSGKVTFSGSPVEKGVIRFEGADHASGGETNLEAGGVYRLELPAGQYTVTVTPLLVTQDAGPESPPTEVYDKVDNIPKQYWAATSSPLKAAVESGELEINFDLQAAPRK